MAAAVQRIEIPPRQSDPPPLPGPGLGVETFSQINWAAYEFRQQIQASRRETKREKDTGSDTPNDAIHGTLLLNADN